MEEIAGAFGEKRDFRVICEGDVMVTADRDLLRTALENLADNAVRYSPEGSVVVMSLRDRVFSMENTVAAAANPEATGVGLQIVAAALDLHGFSHEWKQTEDKAVYTIRMR